MIKVIKRNGEVVEFNKEKIEVAILKAMKYGSGLVDEQLAKSIAKEIECDISDKPSVTIYQIETVVYKKLIENEHELTAKAYEGYRAVQSFKRETNTTDDGILGLIGGTNEEVLKENSNKDSMLVSTQRDLIAGEVSKDITRRKKLPARIVQAHDEGILHFHDADYFAQPMYNCFSGDTKFVSNLGVLRFNECGNGQKVKVLDKDGNWQSATVKKYGKNQLQTITISSGRTIKTIRATKNHRWLLKDGSITTNLQIGDKLHLLQETKVDNINNDMYCFGFVLGDGCDYKNGNSQGLKVRLCGDKARELNNFINAGYTVSSYKQDGSDDVFLTKATNLSKQGFIEAKAWRYLSHEDKVSLFLGYYSADGFKDRNGIATSSRDFALMIREISALAGYHITSEKFEIRTTKYKDNASLYTFRFILSQPSNRNWIVKSINTDDKHLYDTWCVEEPITKTFTLDGGVVTGNCCLVNIKDMLENGTVINKRKIDSPNSFQVACTVMTQIIAQVASMQYGGQSLNIKHLGKFLKRSEDRYFEMLKDSIKSIKDLQNTVDMLVQKELESGIQTIQYQINTLMTTNGQSPFSTLFLELDNDDEYIEYTAKIIEEIIKQRIKGIKNEQGVYTTPSFPKLVYVIDEHNSLNGGKYDYLTKLSAKCSAKRLYPDYISAKKMREHYDGNVFSPMGCRSFINLWKDENDKYKFEGRFNQGVVSINLPQIAIIANGDYDKFWELLDNRLELCYEALMCRHNALLGTKSDVAPILWQYGAIARLEKGEVIDKLLKDGYSSISLGYIGVYETVKLMTGKSHTDNEASKFALEVVSKLREATDRWKSETGIGFGLYSTPSEGLCHRFAQIDKARFGIIKDVTDKGYYMNSYHVDVREEIDAFSKLKFESQFQPIASGGCISYIEIPNMNHNIEAIEEVIKFIYDNIQYAEFNTKSDYCHVCHFDGEIKVNDNYEWECPNCHNKDQNKMNVVRRTCGYLGECYWNAGKTKEIKDRVLHLS